MLVGKPPGLTLSHQIDHHQQPASAMNNPRYGPESILYYLSQNQIFVDVWDGDSLLHLGVAAIPLKSLLRQGKPGITLDEDIDIIWSEVILRVLFIFNFFLKKGYSFLMILPKLYHALLPLLHN